MYASNLGSTNTSDDVQVSTILPQSVPTTSTDNTPLVSAAHGPVSSNILRKMSGIFRVPTRQTESGYVEFGHLENQNIVSSINSQYTESIIDGNTSQKKTLGTFNGVFSPVALSMFSALVFIRVGYIVGNAGLLVTLLQFGIAYGILIFTVASVCAISTNGAVEGGGAYFMISRTLGPEFGGSIGTLFFLANVVSSALCITGCTEGLVENFGPSGYLIADNSEGFLNNSVWYRLLYSTALNGISLALCVIGATMFAKTSVLILAIVTISLSSVIVSFFIMDAQEIPIPNANKLIQNETYHVTFNYTGLNKTTFENNIYPLYGRDYTSLHGDQIHFSAVFGVLFSGVTGIMAGANMSGELKNPGRSIPVGTLSAVAFTLIVYLSLSVLTAATCTRDLLQNNYMYMMPINIWSPFVAIGVLTATFSAALSNLIGGSRVLLALAKDKVFGSFLNFISKGIFRGNPIVAVIVSWALVQLMLFIGSLNLIAQINSVLFLLSYLATNLACVGLQLTSAPNFRPTYTYFSVHTATFGLLGTIAMMFVISPAYAGLSIAACITLVAALHLFASTDRGDKDAPYWGSISQALIFHQVRKYLLMLDSRKNHVKYWRPQILLLVSSPRSCCPLIDFVNDIKKSGLFVLGHVFVPKNGDEPENVLDVTMDPSNKQYPLWLELVDFLKVKAFVELTTASTIREGFQHLVRISGMGAMKPNTIVLGFYDNKKPIDFFNSESSYKTTLFDSEVFNGGDSTITDAFPLQNKKQLDPVQYVLMISDVLNMGKNVCLARHFDTLKKSSIPKNTSIRFIDVWTMNVLKPFDMDGATTFDTNSLFMMQLATICNMVSVWKKLKIRIFVRVKSAEDILRLEELLKLFRIRATVHEIQNWSEIANGLINVNEEQRSNYDDTDDEQTDKSEINMNYIKQLNHIIKEKSANCTAVSFIYLPCPPNFKGNPPYENEFIRFSDNYLSTKVQSDLFEATGITYNCFDHRQINLCHNYLKILTELTKNLPPTVLVHGLNAVTSTTL